MSDIFFCKTCVMPSSRPRLRFNDKGICNACTYHFTIKPNIDWEARATEFKELMDRQSGPFHCVVPFSGGKDSSYVALRIKEMGYSPLAVCYGQLLPTERGIANIRAMQEAGITVLHLQADQEVSRSLARQFFIERGHPKQHYDSAVNAVPIKVAMAFGIDLIVYGEHGETEYGGYVRNEKARRERDLAEVMENQVGDDAANWFDDPDGADAWPYVMPRVSNYPKAVYFSYFFPWDTVGNYEYLVDEVDGKPRTGWRPETFNSDGSFVNFDSIDDMMDDLDYYMMYIKFGFGRATRQANRMIHWGRMSRDEAIEKVHGYDGMPPVRYLSAIQKYLRVDNNEYWSIVDQHRNPEVWERKDGVWHLRKAVWRD